MASNGLPKDPISGQTGPYSLEYIKVATHLKKTGSIAPYSIEYARSVGLDPTR